MWRRYVHVDCGMPCLFHDGPIVAGAPMDYRRVRWHDGVRVDPWDRMQCRRCGGFFNYANLREVREPWLKVVDAAVAWAKRFPWNNRTIPR